MLIVQILDELMSQTPKTLKDINAMRGGEAKMF